MMRQIMICTPYMSNYYLCEFFVEIIAIEKIEKNDDTDDDVYILHVKVYAIKCGT
jgi:hypothetical protein